MKRIGREHITYAFAPGASAVARAAPGETLLFETLDALGGAVRTLEDALSVTLPRERANPATGPVFVEGAHPGDSLVVELLEIKLGARGLGRVKNGGVLIRELKPPVARLAPIEGDRVRFNERLTFPVRPMVGVIGVAPSGQPVATFYPGPHGGNLDINAFGPGSKIYLPVGVDGALLALGDVHASMGDGELTGGGLDIAAEVTVRVDVRRGIGWTWPVIETPAAWCTCFCAPALADAIRGATRSMTALLADRLAMSREEAFILIGAAGDARIGQAAELGMDATAYVVVSKQILPRAF